MKLGRLKREFSCGFGSNIVTLTANDYTVIERGITSSGQHYAVFYHRSGSQNIHFCDGRQLDYAVEDRFSVVVDCMKTNNVGIYDLCQYLKDQDES